YNNQLFWLPTEYLQNTKRLRLSMLLKEHVQPRLRQNVANLHILLPAIADKTLQGTKYQTFLTDVHPGKTMHAYNCRRCIVPTGHLRVIFLPLQPNSKASMLPHDAHQAARTVPVCEKHQQDIHP